MVEQYANLCWGGLLAVILIATRLYRRRRHRGPGFIPQPRRSDPALTLPMPEFLLG